MLEIIPKKPLSFSLFVTRHHKIWAVAAITCVFIATGLGNFMVVVIKELTDSIATPNIDFNTIWLWAIAWPLFYLLANIFWRSSGFTGMRWFMGFRSTAYQYLFEYLSLHSKEYFNNRFVGSLVNKISNAVDGCEFTLEKILWNFMPTLMGIIWYTIFTGINNLVLGLIILLWSVAFISINIWFAGKLRTYSVNFADSQSTLTGRIVDSISNISLVHENAYIAGERKYINSFINKQYKTGVKNWQVSEWILTANSAMISLFLFLLIGSSIYFLQLNLISFGVVLMVIAISAEMSSQLFFIGQELKNVATYYGQTQEGLEEILTPHLIKDSINAHDLVGVKGNISFEKVNFEYENTKVFNDFSIKIKQGQKVGLVGRSGAGKTTFVALLLRHFETQKGSIKIDGQNIKDVTLESLRKSIAFVPQDTALFHRTIFENIAYGSQKSSKKDVITVAKLAQADDFIKKLPNGYETLVGERGVKLSGGQRQRIAIARAFLKDAPILVLDEATSSLDSESEHAIQTSLDILLRGRTVIAIAHRLSTLKKMDRIVVIDNGEIVEDGAPETLLKKANGIFKSMWEHQVSGFILDENLQG